MNRTVARVARRIFHDIIQAAKERRRRFNSGRKRHILKVDESAVETYATAVAGNQRRDPLPAIARNDGDEDQDGESLLVRAGEGAVICFDSQKAHEILV